MLQIHYLCHRLWVFDLYFIKKLSHVFDFFLEWMIVAVYCQKLFFFLPLIKEELFMWFLLLTKALSQSLEFFLLLLGLFGRFSLLVDTTFLDFVLHIFQDLLELLIFQSLLLKKLILPPHDPLKLHSFLCSHFSHDLTGTTLKICHNLRATPILRHQLCFEPFDFLRELSKQRIFWILIYLWLIFYLFCPTGISKCPHGFFIIIWGRRAISNHNSLSISTKRILQKPRQLRISIGNMWAFSINKSRYDVSQSRKWKIYLLRLLKPDSMGLGLVLPFTSC